MFQNNYIAICGFIAAFCTTISFVPQAVMTIRTRNTSSISTTMYSLFTFGTMMWLIYGIMNENPPIIFANLISFLLAATILYCKLKYK